MNMTALRMASFFHPNMWRVRVGRAHSPQERFSDDAALRAMLRKALTIWPDFQSVNACNLRGMLRTYSNTTRVSNFRPSAARAIYAMFSDDGDTVLDFSSGYGGRLVGCLSLRRKYIGIDPCVHQITGLRRTYRQLRRQSPATVELIRDAAEDVLPGIPSRSASLIFSSPPYFHHERYCSESKQCCNRYAAYEEWVDGFLATVVAESGRILRRGGRFVINIADAGGMPLTRDVVRLAGERFAHERTLQLQLAAKPYLRPRTRGVFKTEPIFVFTKK
jgi:SAM-dependent methyltransferase